MEFRTYAANETSALLARLLGRQSEASAQQLRTLRDSLDAAVRAMEGASPQIADDVQELVKRLTNAAGIAVKTASQRARDDAQTFIDAARAELESERARATSLMASLEKAEAEASALRDELHAEGDRVDAVQRDLAAVLEANKHLEAAYLEAQAACATETQARTAVEDELTEVRGLLETALEDTTRISNLMQAEAAETVALKNELAAVYAQLDAAHSTAEAATAREAEVRTALEAELLDVRSSLDAAQATAEAAAAREAEVKSELESELSEVRSLLDAALAEDARLSAELGVTVVEKGKLQAKHEETVRQLQARLDATLTSEKALREQSANGDRETAGARAEIQTLREEVERLGSLFDASIRGVDELANATTVTDLLAALVKQLSKGFSRVALFMVKSNRLEGACQVGFDQTTNVTKLVMPLNVDSPLTRVVTSGVVETLTSSELADGKRVPFAGNSAGALALPIVLQDQTLAVVYADREGQPAAANGEVPASSARFAKLMVRQSVVLLMRLTHELKMLTELREYAVLLLQQAERMHTADVEAGTKGDELRSRLKDSLDYARERYTQRASLEGPAAAALLDEQIAALLQADSKTPFARDLAAVVGRTKETKGRRAAEAS